MVGINSGFGAREDKGIRVLVRAELEAMEIFMDLLDEGGPGGGVAIRLDPNPIRNLRVLVVLVSDFFIQALPHEFLEPLPVLFKNFGSNSRPDQNQIILMIKFSVVA